MVSLPRLIVGTVAMLVICTMVSSIPNTKITSVLCNSGLYSKGDPFATSLAYVLKDLEDFTPLRKGYDYHNISPFPVAFAYGHAACNSTLSTADCATCLVAAKKNMLDTCPGRIGARSLLYDCIIRYEQYTFID